MGSLALLGLVAGTAGFGLATLTGINPGLVKPTLPLLSATSPWTNTPPEVLNTATAEPVSDATLQTPRSTSTPQPTFTPQITNSLTSEIIVRYGESLYPVCRRNCPGLWAWNDVPPSLIRYAQAVCQTNHIPWNNGHPLVYAGQRLIMPPCPTP